MRSRFGRLARFALTQWALGERLIVMSFNVFFCLDKRNLTYVQGGLPAAETSADVGTGGRVPSGHLNLRGPMAFRDVSSLRRLLCLLYASGLGPGFKRRVVDDIRCPLLRLLHRSPAGGYSRSTRTLAVAVGAAALPSTSGSFN